MYDTDSGDEDVSMTSSSTPSSSAGAADRVWLIACSSVAVDAPPTGPLIPHYHQRQQQQLQYQQQQQQQQSWTQWFNDTGDDESTLTTVAAFGVDGAAEGGLDDAECVPPVRLDADPYTVTIYGVVSPAFVLLTLVCNCLVCFVLLTLVCNCLVCVVLMKPQMRNCTNALLVAIAVSDTMTGVLPVPCFLYFYTTGPARYLDYLPFDWCFAYFCLTDYLPTICHTASVWLTVALAAHRYVYVCHPGRAKRLCTMSNVLRTIGVIYAAAALSHLCRFAEHQYRPVGVPLPTGDDSTANNLSANGTLSTVFDSDDDDQTGGVGFEAGAACYNDFSPFVRRYQHVYFNVYYWFRVVCIHLLPCTSLVVLNAGLVGAIRSARFRRLNLLLLRNHHNDHQQQQQQQQQRNTEHQLHPTETQLPAAAQSDDGMTNSDPDGRRRRRLPGGGCGPFRRLRRRQSVVAAARARRLLDTGSSTTLMLVIVVGVFLLVEFPLAVLFIVMITENTFNVEVVTPDVSGMASLALNLVTLVSYPVNFFIYCAMSEQFRRTFRELFVCGGAGRPRRRRLMAAGEDGVDENGGHGDDADGPDAGATATTGTSCCAGVVGLYHHGDGLLRGASTTAAAAAAAAGGGVAGADIGDGRSGRSLHYYVSMLPIRTSPEPTIIIGRHRDSIPY